MISVFDKFKHVVKFSYFKKNEFVREVINNDRIYYDPNIVDFHNQEQDKGTDNRLNRVSDGTAHKTSQLWGTVFRFYNFLKYVKKSNLNILDIGCDDAFIRKMIHSGTYFSGTNYIGCDLKVKSLRKASNKMPKCNTPALFISHDLYKGLKFIKSGTLDIVVCMEVIEHLEKDRGVYLVEEIHRCLKSDGIAFMSQPNHDPSYWYVFKKFRKTGGYPQHLCERTKDDFDKLVSDKFEIIDSYGNLSNRKRYISYLKSKIESSTGDDLIRYRHQLDIFNRLVSIMGPEIPTQVFGQLSYEASGGMIHVLKKKG
jgi:2-polyprenyl-3-methyl-5-hydroxy-6-metoxy-1,4-benzoquinol methylase